MRDNQRKAINNKTSRGKIVVIVVLILLFIMVLFTAGFVYQFIKEKNAQEQWLAHMTDSVEREGFYEGTYLDDIPLAGLTLTQAQELSEQKAVEKLNKLQVKFVYGDQNWMFDYNDINAQIDWEDKLKELYQVARTGELEERYNKIEKLKEQGVYLKTSLSMDTTLIKDDIEAIALSLKTEPVDATIEFFPNKENKFALTPEKAGQMVDAQALYQAAESAIAAGEPEIIEIKTVVLEPKYLMENLKKATNRIVSFSTDLLSSSKNRVHNVVLALDNVNGLRINPGENFSFNDSVGPRTKATGFLTAPAIMPDKSVKDDWGGGVCQSSTTIFNAASLAGLDIVERYHHSFPAKYVPMGLDASVTYGGADLKFKNNKETPIFLKTYQVGKLVYVEIYGEAIPNSGSYKLETELIETVVAPEPKKVEDTEGKYVTVSGGQKEYIESRTGYRVNTYRVLYENGVKVSTETFVKNYYRPIQGIIYYKDKVQPVEESIPKEPTPAPTLAPTLAPVEPTPTPTPEDPTPALDDESDESQDSSNAPVVGE